MCGTGVGELHDAYGVHQWQDDDMPNVRVRDDVSLGLLIAVAGFEVCVQRVQEL